MAGQEASMLPTSPDRSEARRQAEASAGLNDRLREAERLRWQEVYDRAGIRLAGQGINGP